MSATGSRLKYILSRYYPSIVIGLCALFLFYKYILQISPSVMANELMHDFKLNGVSLGNLAATFFYTYLITQLIVGPLLDYFSPRLLTALAIAVGAIGAYLFSQSHVLMYALVARALMGIGVAFATISYMKMAALWFDARKFAFISGLIPTFAMAGSLCGQAPMAWLVDHIGWQKSMFWVSILGFGLALLFYLFVRERQATHLPPQTPAHNTNKLHYLNVLKRKENWLLMCYGGFAFCPLAIFGGLWGNPFLQIQFHISKPQAASLTSMMFLGLAIGGPILCFLSDRLKNRFIILWIGIIISFFSLSGALYLPHNTYTIEALLLFLFGFGTGAYMLSFVIGKEINPLGLAATVIGLINTGDALFGAFSEPFVGKLLDTFWDGKIKNGIHLFSLSDYHLALLVLPIYLVAAAVCLSLLGYFAKISQETS